jgi:hypothetical protein
MNLIDVLKAERRLLHNLHNNFHADLGYLTRVDIGKQLAELDAHIARLESPELVGSVALTIALSTMRETTGKNAQDAIDAVLGRV